MKYLLAGFILALGMSANLPAFAQNTGGVFSPVVNDGHRSAQYRATFDPDSEAFAQRFHYQQSLNDDVMVRGLVQTRKTNDSDVDFDFVQGEIFWELSDADDAWKTGMRFDARIRSDGRPGMLGVNWMTQRALSENWQGRFVVLTSADIGDDARDGVFLGTRAQLAWSGHDTVDLGVQLYSSYGAVDDLQGFDEQTHQLGPTVTARLDHGWGVYANILFGLTDATPDQQLRLWLSRRF